MGIIKTIIITARRRIKIAATTQPLTTTTTTTQLHLLLVSAAWWCRSAEEKYVTLKFLDRPRLPFSTERGDTRHLGEGVHACTSLIRSSHSEWHRTSGQRWVVTGPRHGNSPREGNKNGLKILRFHVLSPNSLPACLPASSHHTQRRKKHDPSISETKNGTKTTDTRQ